MNATRSTRFIGATASVTLGAALLWLLLRHVDWPAVTNRASAIGAGSWAVGVLGLMTSHLLRAGRIRAEWVQTLDMDWRSAWGLVVTHSAWVVLVPMRAGEAVYVWSLHKRGGVNLTHAATSLLKLRVQDMGILACLAVTVWMPVSQTLRAVLGLLLLALMMWWFPWAWRLVRERFRLQTTPSMPAPSARLAWRSWGYAVSNWLVKLVAIGWPLAELSGLDGLTAIPAALGGEWGAAMPFQPPAGLGPYEAGVWAGAHLAHLASSTWTHAATVAPPSINLPAAALAVHLMALLTTVTSALVARLIGWTHLPLLSQNPA